MKKIITAAVAAGVICAVLFAGCKGNGMKGTASTTVRNETTSRESIEEKVTDAMETAKEKLTEAKETLEDAMETGKDMLSEAGSAAESFAEDAATRVSEALPENG